MSKRRHRRGGRTTPKGTQPGVTRPTRHGHAGPPPLVGDAQRALRKSSPLALLSMASGLIEVATPRPADRWRNIPPVTDVRELLSSFVETGLPAMHGLALAGATLTPDELLARQVRHSVGEMPHTPSWLRTMGTIDVTDTILQTDPLGDGDNVLIGWRWPDGTAPTAVVYVDHNMGTIVKDAFVVEENPDSLQQLTLRLGDDHVGFESLDPGAARARVADGIAHGERVVPPLESETWPTCRPMIEWLIRHLPQGGSGYVRPDWPEADRARLLDEFVASPFATIPDLTPAQVRDLADPLVWFACDFGPGDPLRWSPVAVEIVLVDWYPRKVFDLADDVMQRLPDVLAAFAAFAHDRREIPDDLRVATQQAVEMWRDEYLRGAAAPGRSPADNARRLALIAAGVDPSALADDTFDLDDLDDVFDLDDDYDDDFIADDVFDDFIDDFDDDDDLDDLYELDEVDPGEFMERTVIGLEAAVTSLVGGPEAYEALDVEPLGDVAFDWTRVPADMREATEETLGLLDRWSAELFDPEVRTIARVVLAGVVDADRSVFRRSARTDTLAAGILSFLIARLTGRMSPSERRAMPWSVTTQKDLAGATRVSASTISTRTATIANVVARAEIDWPSSLHSSQRAEALRAKQQIEEWRSTQRR